MPNSYDHELIKNYLQSIDKWEEFSTLLNKQKKVTIVTGLWDLGRGQLTGWAQRDFKTYKQNFFQLLQLDIPMCIWVPVELEKEVWEIRSKENTKVYTKEVEDFKNWFPFFNEHDAIRKNPAWYETAGWLKESPQAALPMYNPMMMSKVFMVNDSAIYNPFDSDYFYWIDGGLSLTVPFSMFAGGDIFRNIPLAYTDSIVHIAYPYEPNTEIHGFDKEAFYKECGLKLDSTEVLISRGGFWGGPKNLIHEYNRVYYDIMHSTIAAGHIGADECLFTIAAYKHPELIERFIINNDGLVYPFFEKMADVESFIDEKQKYRVITEFNARVNLYVLGFNSPNQFKLLCERLKSVNLELFEKTRKILINNTLDDSMFAEYDALCNEYGFEEIHKDNIGICGGRQFAAEHFEESDADFYMFFEDDMVFNPPDIADRTCRSGFTSYVPNLYNSLLTIMIKHKFDFLKLTFSEFFGDNSVQWSWYNVPQHIRTEYWPQYDKLPSEGTDPNAPRTKFNNIFTLNGLSYITGEIYYSNWPQIVSRDGNRKMFLEEKWAHPFEQTWMSYMYQRTVKGELLPAILLASPITHDRFEHYDGPLRKES
jgi:hypothetical protein